ncbi:MAG: extracellular solute-binding protein [Treponema sp.]|nr:extracellular solute-binding protein [Treponema sp.]
MRDIARLAGVSCGTVSNVMNRRGNVSTKKIRLVEEAVRRLGYNANAQAQKLRQESSRRLSLILPDIKQTVYSIFYTGLKSLFEEENYDVSLYLTGNSPEAEHLCLQKALSERPEYIITFSCAGNAGEYKNIGSKVIFINNPFIKPGINQFSLSFDFKSSALSFAEYIETKKYSTIALLFDSPVAPEFRYFHKVLKEELEQDQVNLIPFFYDSRQIYHGAAALLAHVPAADLVIVNNPDYGDKLRHIRDFLDCPLPEILSFGMSETVRSSLYPRYELDYRHLARVVFDTVKSGSIEETKPGQSLVIKARGFARSRKEIPSQNKIRELTLLTVTSPTADILSTLTPYLKRCTGLNLKIAALPYDELSQFLASGRARNFDLVRIDTSWSARFERELYHPLGEWVHRVKPLSGAFLPAINKVFVPDIRALFSIPFDPSIQMLFYRRDLFENATVKRLFYEKTKEKLEVPKTYGEYDRIAAFFCASANGESPVCYGTTMVYGSASVAACELLPRIRAMGDGIFDKAGNICVNTPVFRKALEEYLKLKPYSGPEINFWWGDALKLFSSGLSAMTIVFMNHVSGIVRTSDPELSMKVGAAPVPGNFPLLGGGTIGISAQSRKIDPCIEFFNWVYSDEIANMITLLGGLSPCKSVFENEEILEIYPWLRNMEEHYTRGWRRISSKKHPHFDTHQFEQILGNAVRNAAMGIDSPEEALAKAQAECDREL